MNPYKPIILVAGMLWSISAIAADSPVEDATPQQQLATDNDAIAADSPVEDATPQQQLLVDSNNLEQPASTDGTAEVLPVKNVPSSYSMPKDSAKTPFSLSDEGNTVLTLPQAQAIALEHYPQIVAAESATKAAKQEVKIARSYYLPQVTGNAIRAFAGEDTRIGAPGGLNNPTVFDRGSAGVSASQLITDFGRTSDLIESSKLELEARKAQGNLTRETVLLDATRAYYNLLRAQTLLQVAKTTIKTRKTFREQIASLRNAKLKSNLDVSIANQVVAEANLLLLQAKSGVDDAQATLSEALGYSEPRTFTLTDKTKVTPPPADMGKLVQQAMDLNPELASLKAQRNAAKKNAEAEGEAQNPVISALGYAGDTPIHESSQSIQSHSLAGGINVSIPFYTGGRLSAQEHEATDKANIAEQNLITLKNQVLRDIRIAFGNVQTAYQNIDVTQELLGSANESLDLTQERYKIGSSSIVDLSQAQLAQTQAQIESANATYQYLINRALLDYKIGNGISANRVMRE